MIGRGVAYRKMDEMDLLRSKRGSCSSGGVWRTAKRDSTGLQPPWATVDLLQPPRAHVHPASTVRYSTGYCSTTPPPSTVRPPLHHLLFIQPSTPRDPVQPPLHGHPSTVYCSSSPPPHHGVLFIQRQRHRSLFIQTPPATLTVHPIDRLQLAAVAKELLDRVQLTAIDRLLGFSNA